MTQTLYAHMNKIKIKKKMNPIDQFISQKSSDILTKFMPT
jgi:hypothetical protein